MMADDGENNKRRKSIRKASQSSYIINRNAQNELRKKMRKVSEILRKPEQERSVQDILLVKKNPELVKASEKNARRLQANKERILEIEDQPNLLTEKCEKLASLIKASKNVVVYTGAGISTAASIPDYRGPNGVWTLMKKGQELNPQDLSDAEPTFTHMSLTKLFRVGKVKYIVSQNCDGLHIRSGFPRHAVSEVHGNMFIECCYNCVPHKEFIRLFDVTERTGIHRHTTARRCRSCGGSLQDTIVHFGEKGKLKSPYRWKEAVRAAKHADMILCLGSSLKVLRKYACLWCMDKKPQHRPKLVIVNLQWTPKDDFAVLKINGRCDTVMMKVMQLLDYEVAEYKREQDPIFKLCTPLRKYERKTTTKKILIPPSAVEGVATILKSGHSSRNKVSKSSAQNRSRGLTNCTEKQTDLQLSIHMISKSSLLVEPTHLSHKNENSHDRNAEGMKEKQNVNFEEEKLSTGSGECSRFIYPVTANLHALDDEILKSAVLISQHNFSEVVSDSQPHYFQGKNADNHILLSDLPDCIVPKSCKSQKLLNYGLQNFKCGKKVKDKFELTSSPVLQIKHRKHGSIDFFSKDSPGSHQEQADSTGCTNKKIPDLVVINLEKVEGITPVDLQNQQSIPRNGNISNNGTVVYLNSKNWGEVGDHMTEFLRDNSRHNVSAVSCQINSFINRPLTTSKVESFNLLQDMLTTPALEVGKTLSHVPMQAQIVAENGQNTSDLACIIPLISLSNRNSKSVSSMPPYLHLSDQYAEKAECIYTSVLDEKHVCKNTGASENISDSWKCIYSDHHSYAMNCPHYESVICEHVEPKQNALDQEKIKVIIPDSIPVQVFAESLDQFCSESSSQCNNNKMPTHCTNQNESMVSPSVQLALGNIKNICLDHCYTLTEPPSCSRKMGKILKINTRNKKHRQNAWYAKVDCHMERPWYMSDRFWYHNKNGVSSSLSCHTSKQVCCGNNFKSSRSFAQETESVSGTNLDQMKSLQKASAFTRNNHMEKDQIKLHENVWNCNSGFCDERQGSNPDILNGVPSCILNMDDMDIIYTEKNTQTELAHTSNNSSHLTYGGFTHIMESSEVIFPYDCKMLVFPSENKEFSLGSENKQQPFISSSGSDSGCLELNLPNSVSYKCFEKDTIFLSESPISNLFPGANDLDDVCGCSNVDITKSNKQPPADKKEQTHDIFRMKNNFLFIQNGKQNISDISGKPAEQTRDGICGYHLRDTLLEVKEVDMKGRSQTSQVLPDTKKASKHSGSKKEGRENMCRKMYKHKQIPPTISGWFGKGLALRKKRKL